MNYNKGVLKEELHGNYNQIEKYYNKFLKKKIIIGTPDKNIPNNRVETSKYNVITFLPKNIME